MSRLLKLWDSFGLEGDLNLEYEEKSDEAALKSLSKLQIALGNSLLVQRDGVPVQIPSLPWLYLGSLGAAYNFDALKAAGITHILCLSAAVRCKFPDHFAYLRLALDDKADAPLLSIIFEACRFIEDARPAGVLVHCYQGISRSVAVCIAYMIVRHNFTFTSALQTIRAVRPQAAPNSGFIATLKSL
ncbi:dual specificity protein phosphatase family protein, partial [archaeon]